MSWQPPQEALSSSEQNLPQNGRGKTRKVYPRSNTATDVRESFRTHGISEVNQAAVVPQDR